MVIILNILSFKTSHIQINTNLPGIQPPGHYLPTDNNSDCQVTKCNCSLPKPSLFTTIPSVDVASSSWQDLDLNTGTHSLNKVVEIFNDDVPDIK